MTRTYLGYPEQSVRNFMVESFQKKLEQAEDHSQELSIEEEQSK